MPRKCDKASVSMDSLLRAGDGEAEGLFDKVRFVSRSQGPRHRQARGRLPGELMPVLDSVIQYEGTWRSLEASL